MDASQKIQDLGKKIEIAREQVKKLPGIDFTKDEQAAQLKALKKQLVLKEVNSSLMPDFFYILIYFQELIQKYKNLGGDVNLFLNIGKHNGHD